MPHPISKMIHTIALPGMGKASVTVELVGMEKASITVALAGMGNTMLDGTRNKVFRHWLEWENTMLDGTIKKGLSCKLTTSG